MTSDRTPSPAAAVVAQTRRQIALLRLGKGFAAVAALAGLASLPACGNDDTEAPAATAPVPVEASPTPSPAAPVPSPTPPAAPTPPSPPPPSPPPPPPSPPPPPPPPPPAAPPPPAVPVSNCGSGNFLFCEDFESLAAGTATSTLWTIAKSGGSTATIEATPNAQSAPKTLGAKALHLHTGDGQGGSGFAFLVPKTFAPPGNSFFGRVWVWVDAFPIKPDFAHFTLVEVTGTGDGTLVRPIGGQFIPGENKLHALLGVGSDAGPTGDWTDWQPTVPTVDKQWQCLEWQMNASDNIVNVFIDGVAKPELTVSTKKHSVRGGNANVDFRFPAFNQIKIGWQLYQGGATPGFYDLWFDGMALSTTRIGCGG